MTVALLMFAYGARDDQCDEVTSMGASSTLKCLKKFCVQVEYLSSCWYLRPPTAAGCKGYPTVILKVVTSYDTHIWHAFFGTLRAQNDLDVLGASNVFARVINENAPEMSYEINNTTYFVPYYLADGIYPRWQTFFKEIFKHKNAKEAHFTKMQESYHKNVERCFGILHSQWAILFHGANLFKLEDVRTIMISCIILHNMIVKYEFVEAEFEESSEEDNFHPLLASVYERSVDLHDNVIRHDPILRAGETLPIFLEAHFQLHSAYLHKVLQNDLVIHINK